MAWPFGPTVYFIDPLTEAAKEWIKENVVDQNYDEGLLSVEHRYIEDIVEGMQEAGLRLNEDFRVIF